MPSQLMNDSISWMVGMVQVSKASKGAADEC